MINKYHPFHIISMSPWPIVASTLALILTSQTSTRLSGANKSTTIKVTSILTLVTATAWWTDSFKEARKEGFHQKPVTTGLKIGILLFITSEVMFFLRFFWAYFHERISPNIEIGQIWPPNKIKRFNPVNVPLLNTLILISSGVSVTWSHHAIIKNKKSQALKRLIVTCALGVYFSILQFIEYKQAEFRMNDSSYGSVFFLATGFHGIHVIIGSTFLLTTIVIIKTYSISKKHHTGFEMAAWYWHFVDIIWLFLYLSIYWWGK